MFALHLLGQDNLDWVSHFGLRSGRDLDKFSDRPFTTALTGSPLLDGGVGWLDCEVEARLAADEAGYNAADSLFRELGLPFWLAVVLLERAELLMVQDRAGDAEPLLAEAREIFERLDATVWLERVARVVPIGSDTVSAL